MSNLDGEINLFRHNHGHTLDKRWGFDSSYAKIAKDLFSVTFSDRLCVAIFKISQSRQVCLILYGFFVEEETGLQVQPRWIFCFPLCLVFLCHPTYHPALFSSLQVQTKATPKSRNSSNVTKVCAMSHCSKTRSGDSAGDSTVIEENIDKDNLWVNRISAAAWTFPWL